MKKEIAYCAADDLFCDKMRLGLGTGSTAIFLVERLAFKLETKAINDILVVPTSEETRLKCENHNIPLTTLTDPRINGELDLTVDGADEIDKAGFLLKGGGGALLKEKILAAASNSYVIIAEETKLVDFLGQKSPVVCEIRPEAHPVVCKKLKTLGATSFELRTAESLRGPLFTAAGNFLLDVKFKDSFNPISMEKDIKNIPGVVEVGIFCLPVKFFFIGRANGKIEKIKF